MNIMTPNQTILITGGRAPATLHLIRLLKSNNNTIILAESRHSALSRVSNCVDFFYDVPKPRQESEAFIASLVSIIQKHAVSLLIPTCEETFYVSKYKEQLSHYCLVYTMDLHLLNTLHNKASSTEFIQSLNIEGVNTPATYRLSTDRTELLTQVMTMQAPHYIVKPIYSRFGNKVEKFNHDQILSITLNNYKPKSSILQEFIEGQEICVFATCNEGLLQSYSAYATRITSSRTNLYFSHYNDSRLLKKTAHIVESLNYTGFLSFDTIITSENDLYIIECNPRLTSGIHLFSVDAYTHALPKIPLTPNLQTQMSLKLALLTSILTQPLRKFKALRSSKDIIFLSKDIKPSFYQLISYATIVIDALKLHLPIVDLMTHDIEFNEEDLH